MDAKMQSQAREPARSRSSLTVIGLLVSFAIGLVAGMAQAHAGIVEPTVGGWKGKTAQGVPIYFGVREGGVVTNVRLSYRDTVCGKASIHERNVTLKVDESGRFAGIVYPANGGVELEGTFTGPRRVKGRIVAGESSGLPGCTGATISFTAGPKP